MPTWKKVIVSGSQAELAGVTGSFTGSFAGNGANLTGVTATAVFPNTLLTPLTSATQLFANDGSNKYVTAGQVTASAYAGVSGDITISTAGVASIAANSVALGTDTTGDYVATIDPGAGLTGGATSGEGIAHTLAVGAGTHITVNANDVAVNTTTLTPAISGSIFTQISGDLTITAGGVATLAANSIALGTDTTGDYVSSITAGAGVFTTGATSGETISHTVSINSGSMLPYYSGSIFSTVSGDITINAAGVAAIGTGVIVNADVAAAAAIAASKINFSGTSFVSASVLAAGSGQGTYTLTTNGVSSGDVLATGLGTAGTPTFAGLTITNGNIAVNNGTSTALTTTGTTAAVFNTTATTVNAFGAATTLNLGSATGTTTVGNSLVVTGDLFVNGTTTQVNTTDLLVEDKFILLASGSATAGDAGIVVDRGSDAAGNIAYGFDSTTDRWGYQSGLVDTTNALDPTSASGVSGSFAVYSFTEASHGATKPITGEFAVVGSQYLDAAGNFWVYTV
tara:strand:- start:188 stop:1723 length:1536 start_codon:yes stop_codon:yes gene_type:complete